ncbi:uncharacterized protein LOC133197538 [Saccostrea echinata]|uniref:uncharacterized protein LOC133197538 n=1 Tax=Saccostrea echinata TaxID=191078 RepID=UPI002A80B93A|nr:uncharacterized protein LOC133197538 [Saccostrea echinata]
MSTEDERQSLIQKINSLTALIQNATKEKQNKNAIERRQQTSSSRYKVPQRESKRNWYSSSAEPKQPTENAASSHVWVKNKLLTKKDCSDIKEVALNAQNPTTSNSSYQRGSTRKVENASKSLRKEALENKLRETEENIRKLKMCITQKRETQKNVEMSLCQDSKAASASKACDEMAFDKPTLPTRPGHSKELKPKSKTPISDLISCNMQSWGHKEHTRGSCGRSKFCKKSVLKQQPSKVQWKPFGVKKDTSITPISDLITKNLQREQSIRLGQNHPLLTNQQIKTHEKLKYEQPFRNQHKHSTFKKCPLKLNVNSVTPISDQITRNLAKKKTPKYPKFSKDKKWTKNNLSHVCNTQSSSGQLSWQPQSRTDNKYTWQSKTSKSQRAASGIKSKYKISYTAYRNQSWKSKHTPGNTSTWERFSSSGSYGRDIKGGLKHGTSTRNFKYSTWIRRESWRYKQKVKRLHNTTLKKSRYQLDKRGQLPEVRSGQVTRAMASVLQGQCLVMIDGRVYRTSQSQLAGTHASPSQARRGRVSVMKKNFSLTPQVYRKWKSSLTPQVNRKWKSSLTPQVNREWKSQHLAKTINSHNFTMRILASRVLQKSIQTAATKFKKKKTEQYCMFYNRFGKCNHGDKCKYIHDPEKVAVCTRFLRGTCNIVDCPFSHKVDKDKMPVCSYFLRGVCSRDNCPYLHVKVNKNAEVCQDFLQGFCSKGAKCKKRHTLTCQSFAASGSCPDGDKCRLKHHKQKTRKRKSSETNTKNAALEKLPDDLDETSENIPLKQRKLPAYISINKTSGGQKVDTLPPVETSGQNKKLKIKPEF